MLRTATLFFPATFWALCSLLLAGSAVADYLDTLLTVVIWLLFIYLLFSSPVHLWVFRRLIRLEYDSHRENWLQDGKPTAPFFRRPESMTWGRWFISLDSRRATTRCYWGWMIATPEWMRRDRRALRLVRWMRGLVIAWWVAFLVVAVTFIAIAIANIAQGNLK